MLKIAVFVSGGGTDLQSVIDAIEANQINGKIVLVISNRKNAYGLERAKKAGIETAVVKKDDELIVKMLKEREVDLVVLAGYLAILSDVLIDAYPNKIINIHPSLIPSFCGPGYYGMHVHEAVLKRGVKVTGATVHFVTINSRLHHAYKKLPELNWLMVTMGTAYVYKQKESAS